MLTTDRSVQKHSYGDIDLWSEWTQEGCDKWRWVEAPCRFRLHSPVPTACDKARSRKMKMLGHDIFLSILFNLLTLNESQSV